MVPTAKSAGDSKLVNASLEKLRSLVLAQETINSESLWAATLATAEAATGNISTAKQVLSKIKMDQSDFWSFERSKDSGYLGLSKVFLERKEPDQALAMLSNVILRGDKISLLTNVAHFYIKQGNKATARKVLSRARYIPPDGAGQHTPVVKDYDAEFAYMTALSGDVAVAKEFVRPVDPRKEYLMLGYSDVPGLGMARIAAAQAENHDVAGARITLQRAFKLSINYQRSFGVAVRMPALASILSVQAKISDQDGYQRTKNEMDECFREAPSYWYTSEYGCSEIITILARSGDIAGASEYFSVIVAKFPSTDGVDAVEGDPLFRSLLAIIEAQMKQHRFVEACANIEMYEQFVDRYDGRFGRDVDRDARKALALTELSRVIFASLGQ